MRTRLRLIVLIKQVPTTGDVWLDPNTKTLVRTGVSQVVSALDRRAMAEAVRLKREHGAHITAVTMGPDQVRKALVECLAAGADEAVHLCDAELAGSDTIVTARALSAVLRSRPFDLVLAGQYSTDSGTGHVGPQVAELLRIPQVTGVTELQLDVDRRSIMVVRETDDGLETVAVPMPALVTAAERLNRPGLPSSEELERAARLPIETVRATDIAAAGPFGLAASPTRVGELRSIAIERDRRVIGGGSVAEQADAIARYLVEEVGLFGKWRRARAPVPWPDRSYDAGDRPVWAVVDIGPNGLRPVSYELLATGKPLAARLQSPLVAVVLSDDGERYGRELAAYGADRVLLVDDPLLATYSAETFADALTQLLTRYRPHVMLMPATSAGRDYAPRAAARLGLGLTGDAIGWEVDAEGNVALLKPAVGGSIVAPILTRTIPIMATIRPGMVRPLAPHDDRVAPVEHVKVHLRPPSVTIVTRELAVDPGTDIASTDVVIGVGAGLGAQERLDAVRSLAETMGAAIGGTRKVVDRGWLPRQCQIGISGRAIAPELYLALGVSGGLNHTVGITQAGTIVAVNQAADAPMGKVSDLFVVADVHALIPELIAALERWRRRH